MNGTECELGLCLGDGWQPRLLSSLRDALENCVNRARQEMTEEGLDEEDVEAVLGVAEDGDEKWARNYILLNSGRLNDRPVSLMRRLVKDLGKCRRDLYLAESRAAKGGRI
jgi:hypothetical protein